MRAEFGVEVRTLSVDLTAPDMLEQVRVLTDDIAVGMLIYNAGTDNAGSPTICSTGSVVARGG